MATSEFGKAFAAARKAGGKTFDFNGKKYTTELTPSTRSATIAQSTAIENKRFAQAPKQAATNARAQSTADGTRASRLAAQAAERNVVERARVRNAADAASMKQSDSITARKSREAQASQRTRDADAAYFDSFAKRKK